jgi:hypothetical protein
MQIHADMQWRVQGSSQKQPSFSQVIITPSNAASYHDRKHDRLNYNIHLRWRALSRLPVGARDRAQEDSGSRAQEVTSQGECQNEGQGPVPARELHP